MRNATRRIVPAVVALGLMAAMAGRAVAAQVLEVGDAGQSRATAQVTTTGDGIVDSILGSLSTINDVDAYQILITGGSFSAATVNPPTSFDPMLSLFSSSGARVLFNDDFTGFQSFISATNLASGTYYLAISSFSNGYFQANLDNPWDNSGGSSGSYRINLTGATSAVAAVPEPSLVVLGASALPVGLIAWRRRRKAPAA